MYRDVMMFPFLIGKVLTFKSEITGWRRIQDGELFPFLIGKVLTGFYVVYKQDSVSIPYR